MGERIAAVDAILDKAPEPQRTTLQEVRNRVHALFPDVEECISYGLPAFRVTGVVVAGIAARKDGCSWYPMSGSLLDAFDVEGMGYTRTSGSMHFPKDKPLTKALIGRLIKARLQLAEDAPTRR